MLLGPFLEFAIHVSPGSVGDAPFGQSGSSELGQRGINQRRNALERGSPVAVAASKDGIVHPLEARLVGYASQPRHETRGVIRGLTLVRSGDDYERPVLFDFINGRIHLRDSGRP